MLAAFAPATPEHDISSWLAVTVDEPIGEPPEEVFECGSPPEPYDDDIQTVPAGGGPCGTGEQSSSMQTADRTAREAALREIAESFDPFSCEECEDEGNCVPLSRANPSDDAWSYERLLEMTPDGLRITTTACLEEGGFYLRTCTDC